MNLLLYISIIGLLGLSAFFSGSEIAFASVNDRKLSQMKKNNDNKAATALYIYNNFESALSTILIGNNLVNIAASSISTIIVIQLIGDKGVFLSTIVMTIFVLIFGEITPKLVAKTYSIKFTLFAAYPILILMKILTPINIIVARFLYLVSKLWEDKTEKNYSITEEEIILLINDSEEDGFIDKERSELLKSSLVYSDIQAQEILTSRTDMLSIDLESDFEEIKKTVLDSPFTRIPVYEGQIDNIIGILHTNNFLLKCVEENVFDIKEVLSDPIYIYETMKIRDIFNKLNSEFMHMGIVVDEYGGTLGCITIEDILEELVGEIWDESDVVTKEIINLTKNKYLVNGDVSLRDLNDFLDVYYYEIESEYNTVGGWTIEMFDRLPNKGEKFTYENLIVEVCKVDENRVLEVIIEIKNPLSTNN